MTALLSSMFYASADHSAILKSDDHNALLQVETFARCCCNFSPGCLLSLCCCCASSASHVSFPALQSNRAFCDFRHVKFNEGAPSLAASFVAHFCSRIECWWQRKLLTLVQASAQRSHGSIFHKFCISDSYWWQHRSFFETKGIRCQQWEQYLSEELMAQSRCVYKYL